MRSFFLALLAALGVIVALPISGVLSSSSRAPGRDAAVVLRARRADAAPAPVAPVRESHVAWTHDRDVEVFADPTNPVPVLRLPRLTETGARRALLVVGETQGWLQVLLPVRPNGTVGWVQRGHFDLTTTHDELRVNLAARRIDWYRGSTLVARGVAAIGKPATPTPPGRYFVTETFASSGPYGAWTLALNGFSEVFETFNGGEPRLAIHGTNTPASLGSAISNGCIRIPADILDALAREISAGTPVVVT